MWTVSAGTSGASAIATSAQKTIIGRRIGWWTMKSMPSRMSATIEVSARSLGARRSRRMSARAKLDRANDAASIASVRPGPMVAARKPAMAGPMM